MTTRVLDPAVRARTLPGCFPADGLEESVRTLLHRLPWRGTDACPPLRTLGLTSCSRGEGVSTVAARLAAEAALMSREPVLLADANLASPAVHRLVGVNAGPGLAELLRQGLSLPAVLQPSAVARLSVLAAGQVDADPASLHDAPGLAGLLAMLKEQFALCIFDLPSAVPGASRLASLLDGIVLVVEAERTLLQTVRQVKERLEDQVQFLGVVLNKRRRYIPEWLDRFLETGAS